jgi:hypothetical protein
VFSHSSLYDDCPIDPRMQFLYEETLIAPRSYTAGWELFHPHVAPLQHRWNRSYRRTNWQDIDMRPLTAAGAEAYHSVIAGKGGKYGFGKVRSLADYERHSGIKFSKRKLAVSARQGLPSGK